MTKPSSLFFQVIGSLGFYFFLETDILMWSAGKISSENPKDMSFMWLLLKNHPGMWGSFTQWTWLAYHVPCFVTEEGWVTSMMTECSRKDQFIYHNTAPSPPKYYRVFVRLVRLIACLPRDYRMRPCTQVGFSWRFWLHCHFSFFNFWFLRTIFKNLKDAIGG